MSDAQPTRHSNGTEATGNSSAAPSETRPEPARTVKEAATLLGISPSLVYRLCAAGKIRYERHGLGRGVIRIPPEALGEYRKQATVTGTGGAATPPPALPRVKLSHIKL